MKKLISLVLCLTLVFTLALTVPFAAHADSAEDETLQSLLVMAMGDAFGDADTQLDVTNGNVILRIDLGLDDSVVALGKYDSDIMQSWATLKKNFSELCGSVVTLLDSMSVENGSCTVLLVNDAHAQNATVYLCVVNGVVVIDVLA